MRHSPPAHYAAPYAYHPLRGTGQEWINTTDTGVLCTSALRDCIPWRRGHSLRTHAAGGRRDAGARWLPATTSACRAFVPTPPQPSLVYITQHSLPLVFSRVRCYLHLSVNCLQAGGRARAMATKRSSGSRLPTAVCRCLRLLPPARCFTTLLHASPSHLALPTAAPALPAWRRGGGRATATRCIPFGSGRTGGRAALYLPAVYRPVRQSAATHHTATATRGMTDITTTTA